MKNYKSKSQDEKTRLLNTFWKETKVCQHMGGKYKNICVVL